MSPDIVLGFILRVRHDFVQLLFIIWLFPVCNESLKYFRGEEGRGAVLKHKQSKNE